MTTKKSRRLTSIVLLGALTLGIAGCHKDHSQYYYNGKIGEDVVNFKEKLYPLGSDDNILTITKPDGRVINCVDILKEDLILEYVEITKDGQTTKYTPHNEIGRPIVEEAQKYFDAYMQKIKEAKINQGLENLK